MSKSKFNSWGLVFVASPIFVALLFYYLSGNWTQACQAPNPHEKWWLHDLLFGANSAPFWVFVEGIHGALLMTFFFVLGLALFAVKRYRPYLSLFWISCSVGIFVLRATGTAVFCDFTGV